jgi:hypothetical protein
MPFHCPEYWEVRARRWTERALDCTDDPYLRHLMLQLADRYIKLARQRRKLDLMVVEESC